MREQFFGYKSILYIFILASLFSFSAEKVYAQPVIAPTSTVIVSICGDANLTPGEVCDDGTANNDGVYSTSIAGRRCNADCTAYGPYCGDTILQTTYSETCDDGNNQDGDFCTASCEVVDAPVSSGGGGGGGFVSGSFIPVPDASVSISGKAYPNSDVNILQDGEVIGVVKADGGANFFFTTSEVTPGTVTFGFWAEDQNGLRSTSFNTTFQVAQSAVTNISNIFLPPTLELSDRTLDAGDVLTLSGQSVPEVTINSVVNSEHEIITLASTTDDGFFEIEVDTTPLEEDIHTAKAQFLTTANGIAVESAFSSALSFFIGEAFTDFVGPTDLNVDGFVNLIDFSILLFHWGTDGGDSDPPADINLDGTVNLTDFSIMIFNWTG
jgi:cysteine-rich repeat protein